MVISFLLKHKMHVRWPVWMPMQLLQQLAHGSIVRNGIWYGGDGIKPEDTVFTGAHNAPSVWSFTASILYIVMTRRICLPNIDLGTLNRAALGIAEGANHQ